MIDVAKAYSYCKEDIQLIENYDKAKADCSQTWICHHKDEVRFLPSGMIVTRSAEELMENGRYFNCPANELVFLPRDYHCAFHNKYMNNERKIKQVNHCKKIGHLGANVRKERHSNWFKAYGMNKAEIMAKYNLSRTAVEQLHKNNKLKDLMEVNTWH